MVWSLIFSENNKNLQKGANDMVKVQVKHLTKVFGKRSQAALKMVQEGRPKTEIVEKQAQQLGFMTPTLM